MTDVYIAYAREDRERVRPLAEGLQFEGWDVWWDPSEPTLDSSAAVDQKLGSAGAIVVVWSAYSRGSEYVRSEAATGLYKNKLIQVRIDGAAPPRPFDQLEVADIGYWSGDRDDPNWRQILSSIRLFAGPPTGIQLQPARRTRSRPTYVETSRSVAPGPIIAAGLLIAAGGGVWMLDPFNWRSPSSDATVVAATSAGEAAGGPVANDSPAALADWSRVDQQQPAGLRAYIAEHPKSNRAETARSMLRVLDAQAWVAAVTADNEAGYSDYLKVFPAKGAIPGAMASAANERLATLGVERQQATEEIQRGLAALDLYRGEIDGKAGPGTMSAVTRFASNNRLTHPDLKAAAPRDLRMFADEIADVAADAGVTSSEPNIAVATATIPAPSSNAAAEADRRRLEQARAAAAAAAAEQQKAEAEEPGAENLALAELQRTADARAWSEAERIGTAASYQSYLASFPAGAQVAAARSALGRLSRPAAFSIDLVSPAIRTAVDAARRAQTTAMNRALAAREAAAAAQGAPDRHNIVASNGDHYETQIANGAPNGFGVRISAANRSDGDRYSGQLRNGLSSGLGVYEFAVNPNNAESGALRYEGEYAGDTTTGYGVMYWKNGDRFAGQEAGASGDARGVLTFANGQRYEGEMRNGKRHGLGVVWSREGQVVMAGRWENGELVEPAALEAAPARSSDTQEG